ncbi:SWI4 [Candida pseudojiufengensis]|uniref:SWI4 n=1 Tax=Candida pseudojiufengensis TaxID=497109 RepID=UPI0022242C3B|nr:SWI4 [Candida pseudojiufengensis]KAI5966236.1 SWI4 [Candida pseudojiufengensis]
MPGPPPVFRATYSNTDVYECDMNESPIMRRCKDDWVNATQILKCCNFPKAKRTKILEKGVQQGLHEKVQGGFGRFQGTWIPLEDARRLAATYGVTKELAPVLFLDFTDPNLIIPQKAKPPPKENPTGMKRKYVKKPKLPGDTPRKYKTGKKAALQAAEEAAAVKDPNNHLQESFTSQESSNINSRQNSFNGPQYPQMYNMSQTMVPQPPQVMDQPFNEHNIPINVNTNLPYANNFQNQQLLQQQQLPPQAPSQQIPLQQPHPPQHAFPNPNQIPKQFPMSNQIHQQVFQHGKLSSSQSSNDTNWSISQDQRDSDTSINSNPDDRRVKVYDNDNSQYPQQGSSPNEENSYAAQLLKFFSEDNTEIPYFVQFPPNDFNINESIDDEGHTPLHWAASIGNYEMIHVLVSKGANPLIVNNFGLNPLSKLISFNNCYELRNFDKVLDDLELCLINTDINGRTPLHYLCQFAKVKSKFESLRVYLNTILIKLTSLSNRNPARSVDLMKNVLNHQDVRGDTCLHIAIKSGCISFVKTLLKYGARDDVENINRETARGLIMQFNLIPNYVQIDAAQTAFQQQLQMRFQNFPQQQQQQQQLQSQENQLQPQPLPQQPKLQSQHIEPTPEITSNGTSGLIEGLATPIQPPTFNRVETPDTQRTTVQDDDMDEEENVARVDSKHLDALNDDKENIFIDKQFDNVSTPLHKNFLTAGHHQPLAVISEVESSTTPIINNHLSKNETVVDKLSPQLKQDVPSIKQFHTKPLGKLNIPKLDNDGRIIEENQTKSNLPFQDLSSIVTNLINSYSDSYSKESNKLDEDIEQMKHLITSKQIEAQNSIKNIINLFHSSGIEENEINSIDQAHTIVNNYIESFQKQIVEKEKQLTNIIQKNQSKILTNLIQEEETKSMATQHDQSQEDDDEEESELFNETKFDYALELTNLQIKRKKLINEIITKTKQYGINNKMYKYRKLISLSCGIKVEDIDSLIDGILSNI